MPNWSPLPPEVVLVAGALVVAAGAVTVAAVAYRWGFAHLGRFAAVYRSRFGVTPSEDLKADG